MQRSGGSYLLKGHQKLDDRAVNTKTIYQVGRGKLKYSEVNFATEGGLKSPVIKDETSKIVCGPRQMVPVQAGES